MRKYKIGDIVIYKSEVQAYDRILFIITEFKDKDSYWGTRFNHADNSRYVLPDEKIHGKYIRTKADIEKQLIL